MSNVAVCVHTHSRHNFLYLGFLLLSALSLRTGENERSKWWKFIDTFILWMVYRACTMWCQLKFVRLWCLWLCAYAFKCDLSPFSKHFLPVGCDNKFSLHSFLHCLCVHSFKPCFILHILCCCFSYLSPILDLWYYILFCGICIRL